MADGPEPNSTAAETGTSTTNELSQLAWDVERLISDGPVFDRFLAQCQQYVQCQAADPHRRLPLPFAGSLIAQFDLEEPRRLELCDEYAILAAIHSNICLQRRHVDPTPDASLDDRDAFRNYIIWANLRSAARQITVAELPDLRACQRSVELDLNRVVNTPLAPTSIVSTGNHSVDERLNELLRTLAGDCPPAIPEFETLVPVLQSIAIFLWTSSQSGRFKHADEKEFQKEFVAFLREKLGPEVTEHPSQSGGLLDVRYMGVTIELKVEKKDGDRQAICGRYAAQPTQYAGSEARQVSVVVVLDLTEKQEPPGDIRNDILLASVPTHGGADAGKAFPSRAFVFILNGNLRNPSSYSH